MDIKTILLAVYNPEVMVNLTYCGNNCIPYLLEIAESKDIYVSCSRSLSLYTDSYPSYGYKVYVMNSESIISTFDEYMDVWEVCRGLFVSEEHPMGVETGGEEKYYGCG